MKNITKVFLSLLLVGIVLSGCEEAEELLDVKFDANYDTEIDVTITPGTKSVNGVFNVTETIDPNSDSQFAEYASKIKGIDISEVTTEILYINPNVTLVSTNLSIFNDKSSVTWTFTNEELSVGTVLTLDNNAGQWNTVEDILMDKSVFTVTINGETVEDNAEFIILIKLKSEVTASPLD